MQSGQTLAALKAYYAGFRTSFLKWGAATFKRDDATLLANYKRSLIAWYEATLRPREPYRGEADEFVKALTRYYFNPREVAAQSALPFGEELPLEAERRPLRYIPKAVQLDARQTQMLAQFQQMGTSCKELLLMTHYHCIEPGRMAQALDLAGGAEEVREQLRTCELMARESWEGLGLIASHQLPSPSDEALLEAYFSNQLDAPDRWALEARFPNDPMLREALALREDWAEVLLVAGRQDLVAVLQREETAIQQRAVPRAANPPTPPGGGFAPAASPTTDVKLSPRRRVNVPSFEVPSLQTIVALLAFGCFLYLAWTTIGPAAPENRAVDNFEPFPNIFLQDPPATEDERDLQRILYYYDLGDYRTAYDELLPVADAYPAAPLYLGVSALALDQPSRALEWLERTPESNYYHEATEWYEALAYLALKRQQGARATLLDITETPNHPYRQRAELLLAEIN